MKLILLDRGDRPQLTEWTLERFKGHQVIRPDFPAVDGVKDIAKRLRLGVQEAGNDFVYIIENDDYYPVDYIEKMEKKRKQTQANWIGGTRPHYYHIASRTWQHYPQMGVSGLWCMGFETRIMDYIPWLDDQHVSMDSWISREVMKLPWVRAESFSDHGGIGIKGHGVGMSGSISHKRPLKNPDPDLTWLKARTDESFIKLHYDENI
jgi:hypothetical protein